MAAVAEPAGILMKVPCTQCGRRFLYRKTYNVMRRFCVDCAEERTAKSKLKFEAGKKGGPIRDPEEAEACRILQQIPDSVNWHSVLGRISASC